MPDTRSRNMVMNAIAPVWDGNETWLVLGGVDVGLPSHGQFQLGSGLVEALAGCWR
jgi:hypothetical protein